jgi:lipid-A-disaccharide synthase
VTGELSGDLHAAEVARGMKRRDRNLRILALGGPHLARAGAALVARIDGIGVVGFWEIFRQFTRIRKAFDKVLESLKTEKPDLVVLVDYPGFNIPLVRKIQHLRPRTKIVYYISPQVWAWKYGRVRTLRKCVDAVGVLLPFEKAIYDKEHIPAAYFGHPLASSVRPDPVRRGKSVLFMPGSRMHEVRALLPVMVRVMERLKRGDPSWTFLVSCASTIDRAEIERRLPSGCGARIVEGRPFGKVSCVCAASGTATLEASLALKPVVVLYKVHPVSMILYRLLSRVRFVSLTNILLGRALLSEFVGPVLDADRIASAVRVAVGPGSGRERLITGMRRVRAMLLRASPWDRTSEWLLGFLRDGR